MTPLRKATSYSRISSVSATPWAMRHVSARSLPRKSFRFPLAWRIYAEHSENPCRTRVALSCLSELLCEHYVLRNRGDDYRRFFWRDLALPALAAPLFLGFLRYTPSSSTVAPSRSRAEFIRIAFAKRVIHPPKKRMFP